MELKEQDEDYRVLCPVPVPVGAEGMVPDRDGFASSGGQTRAGERPGVNPDCGV
jgi:hypothetical protein